jgi:intracellular septation protein
MKLFFDFLPIILFFGAFKAAEANPAASSQLATQYLGFMVSGGLVGTREAPVVLATVVVILATLAQVAWMLGRGRRVEPALWVSLALVVVLGGATIWFHDEAFIKWKPSVLYWVMGFVLWASQVLFRRNLLRAMLGAQLELPGLVWQRLNFAWVAFFVFMGLLNLYVAHSFSTDAWVNFKLFGGLGLLLLFTLAQGLYLSRYLKDDDEVGATPPSGSSKSAP